MPTLAVRLIVLQHFPFPFPSFPLQEGLEEGLNVKEKRYQIKEEEDENRLYNGIG